MFASHIVNDPQSGQLYLAAVAFLALTAVLVIGAMRSMSEQRPVGLFQLLTLVPLAFGGHLYFMMLTPGRSLLGLEMADWTLITWITAMLAPALVIGSASIALWDFTSRRREAALTYLSFGAALFLFAYVFGRYWPEVVTAMTVVMISALMVRRAVARAD